MKTGSIFRSPYFLFFGCFITWRNLLFDLSGCLLCVGKIARLSDAAAFFPLDALVLLTMVSLTISAFDISYQQRKEFHSYTNGEKFSGGFVFRGKDQ